MALKERIDLKADKNKLNLINQAVNALGCTRTDFMIEASVEKAQQILLDRNLVYLDEVDMDYINDPNPQPDPVVTELF